MRKWLMWYAMLSKRLFARGGFLALLLLIPMLIPAANIAMQGESGVLTIALVQEGEDARAKAVVEKLKTDDSVMRYIEVSTEEEGIRAVESGKADAAWVFREDFSEAQKKYAKGNSRTPYVVVYQRDETVPLQLASEKLFAAVYPDFAYDVLDGFVAEKVDPDGNNISEKTKGIFDHISRNQDLVVMKKLDSEETVTSTNILLAPLRGLLSVVCVLCGFAAAIYLLWDIKEGRFDWMQEEKRVIPLVISVFSAVVPAVVAALVALILSGAGTGWGELPSALVLILGASGFCVCLAILFPSAEKLGAAIPGAAVALIALSPIFFNVKALKPLRLMLPLHYYLQSVYDKTYLLYGLLYALCAFCVAAGLCFMKRKIKK